MKTKNVTNLLLTSSILFLSACSTTPTPLVKSIKHKNSGLSAYNIMGIDSTPSNHHPIFVVAKRAKTNFNIRIIEPIKDIEPMETIFPVESENIENYPEATYVSDTPPTTTYPMNTSPIINDDIEIITYASTKPIYESLYSPNIEVVSYGSSNTKSYLSGYRSRQNSSIIKNEIENKAKSFLGTKYVWGATGPSKFDCSGFTQWVYRDSGITIPRVSKDQAKVGQYVSYKNLRRGDMVFFDTKKQRSGIVTHVGIYLGNHNFIHASSSAKKVVIFNFNDKPYYKERFLWGRRVINNDNHFASR